MKKGLIVISVLLAVAAGVAALLWHAGAFSSPQYVTIGGQTYRFAGLTYGTNHLVGTWLGKLVARLPKPLAGAVTAIAGSGQTQTTTSLRPSVCVWLESQRPIATTGGGTIYYALLADENGIMAGRQAINSAGGYMSPRWVGAMFSDLPRRNRTVQCVLFQYVPPDGQPGKYNEVGRIHFTNPLYGQYPQWQPESLPAVKTNGDLAVTLEGFISGVSGSTSSEPDGHGGWHVANARATAGEEPHAAFDLTFRSSGNTNEEWTFHGGELSDATGNSIRAESWGNTEKHFTMGPTLWPSEAAWRLKLELKRTAGFAPDELAVFHDLTVPTIGGTNKPSLTNMVNGVEIDVTKFLRAPDITGSSWNSNNASDIHVHHSTLPKDMSFDFVRAETDDHRQLEVVSRSWSDNDYDVGFKSIPTNATRLNLTYAVQKTRTVEFMVKP